MLAGKPPFDGENAMAIAVQHVKDEPESLLDLRPDVPHELISLVKKMTSKAPDDRPENAAEILKSLRKVNVDSDLDWNEMADRLASDAKSDLKKSEAIRSEAARRLDSAMRGNVRSWWTNPYTAFAFLLLGIGGLFGGVYLSNAIPSKQLLDRELTSAQGVPKRNGVIEQYRAAYNFPSEAKWQAVIDLHPIEEGDDAGVRNEKHLYHKYAYERIGEHYLVNKEFEKAQDFYDQRISAESTEEPNYRFNLVWKVGFSLAMHADGEGFSAARLIDDWYPELYNQAVLKELNGTLRPMFEELLQKLND